MSDQMILGLEKWVKKADHLHKIKPFIHFTVIASRNVKF